MEKTYWITGASSGIGKALALHLAEAGHYLLISSRNPQALEAVRTQCAFPDRVKILPLDLAQHERATEWTAQAVDLMDRIDVLINNGGVGQFGSAMETKPEVEQHLYAVNFHAPIALAKALLPHLQQQGGGKIVSIASIAGEFGQRNLAAYSASKAALIRYMESWKEELHGSNVSLQVISPGFINTSVTLNSLDAQGNPLNKNSSAQEKGMPAAAFAAKAAKVMQGNRFYSRIGRKELLAIPLHFFIPALFYRLLRK